MWDIRIQFVDVNERQDYVGYLEDNFLEGEAEDYIITSTHRHHNLRLTINAIEVFQKAIPELTSKYVLWKIDMKPLESPI